MNSEKIRVTVWNEFIHEKESPEIQKIYPEGIHRAIAGYLNKCPGLELTTATMEKPDHGLTNDILESTDVLIWWGHMAHDNVQDKIVDKIYHRIINEGMGLIVLHSAHYSKIFKRLMGTTCDLKWREADEKERLWVVSPGHPITKDIEDFFELQNAEMYGEHFDIPNPDELVFISWFQGGEVFRSGCCFYRGLGKIFYFAPGHETYPIYFNPNVMKVIENACHWAARIIRKTPTRGNVKPLEEINS